VGHRRHHEEIKGNHILHVVFQERLPGRRRRRARSFQPAFPRPSPPENP
jgi:hypothetical protein